MTHTSPYRALVVTCDVDWDRRHPALASAAVATACRDRSVVPHLVPLPQGSGRLTTLDARTALALMPFDTYGDVLVALGHPGALLTHARTVVVVDGRCGEQLRPQDRLVDDAPRRALREGLRRAQAVLSTDLRTLSDLDRHACRGTAMVEDAVGLITSVARVLGLADEQRGST